MAELGDIRTIQSDAGEQAVSGAAKVAALGGALDLTNKVIGEAVKGDLIGDLIEVEEKATASAADLRLAEEDAIGGEGSLVDAQFPPSVQLGARAAFENIAKLTSVADQARSSNTKNRAILEMQTALARAKNKYPWAADQLDAAASRYMSSSVGLMNLGMQDTISSQESQAQKLAKAQLDDIQKYANDTLGMDPAKFPFGSPDFTNEYTLRSGHQQEAQIADLKIAAVQGRANASAQDSLEAYQGQLDGVGGNFHRFMALIEDRVTPLNEARKLARLNNSPANTNALAAAEDLFQNATLPQFRADFASVRTSINRQFDKTFPGAMATSPHGVKAREMADSKIQDLTLYMEALEAGNVNVSEFMTLQGRMRGQKRLATSPPLQDFSDMLLAPGFEKTVDLWTKFDQTFSSPMLQDLISKGFQSQLAPLFQDLGRLNSETPFGGSANDRERARSDMRTRSDSPTGVIISRDPIENAKASTMQVEKWASVAPEFLDATNSNAALMDTANQLESIMEGMGQEFPPVQEDTIYESLATENYWDLMETAGLDSAATADIANTLANKWFSPVVGTGDSMARRNGQVTGLALSDGLQATVDRGAIPLIDLLEIDDSKLESDGILKFTLNESEARKNYVATRDIGLVSGGLKALGALDLPGEGLVRAAASTVSAAIAPTPLQNQRVEDEAIRELHQRAAELTKQTTNYLRVTALIDAGISGTERNFLVGLVNAGAGADLIDVLRIPERVEAEQGQ